MTRPRYDDHSTEFGLWLRKQKEIDSRLGFVASNIDYVWHNYVSGKWMIIEEKRHNAEIRFCQKQIFKMVDESILNLKYSGFYFLKFENTGPEDGDIFLNSIKITKEQLLNFLVNFDIP